MGARDSIGSWLTCLLIGFAAVMFSLLGGGGRGAELAGPAEAKASGTLEAPSQLTAIAVSQSRIDLSWQDNSTRESGFEIYRSNSGLPGTFTLIARAPANAESYTDDGPAALGQYCYETRAFRLSKRADSYSAFSNQSCTTNSTVASVVVIPGSASAVVGGYVAFRAEVRDSSGTLMEVPVTWTTDDAAVATVSANGRATALARGRAVVTATAAGMSGSADLVVVAPIRVSSHTTGADLDPDGYYLSVDGSSGGGSFWYLGIDDSKEWSLTAGGHTVGLGDVASNCTVAGDNPRPVSITPDADTVLDFEIDCIATDKVAYVYWDECPWSLCEADGVLEAVGTAVANADGTDSSIGLWGAFYPDWSPDGRMIAFSSREADIGFFDVATGAVTMLTQDAYYDSSPSWSPDGNQIAFASWRDGQPGLYLIGVDGSGLVQLAAAVGFRGSPAWSPDGTRIAFDCEIEAGNRDMCAVNLDGSGFVRLVATPGLDADPAWSPDGTKIAFTTTRFGGGESIAVLDLETGAVHQVDTAIPAAGPAWSPDGSRIAYSTEVCEEWACSPEVRVAALDASRSSQVVGIGTEPAWRPRVPTE